MTSLEEHRVPDPVKQALTLLEVCDHDLAEARATVATNLKFAPTENAMFYWREVGDALGLGPH